MVKIKKEALLITPDMIKPTNGFKVVGTFNPAAARLKNGDICLYVRVAEKLIKDESKDGKYYYAPRCDGKKTCEMKLDKFKKKDIEIKSEVDILFKDETKRLLFISHLRRVVLGKDGFTIKSIDKKPSFQGLVNDGELGIEDARITKIDNKYYMTYVALSIQGNISTSYAVSKNCKDWKREGIIFREQNKDCVLFPEKINSRYFSFNRPESSFKFSLPHIWLSESKDLNHWGEPKPIKLAKKGSWDYSRVGAGCPPIKTDKGWLLIYHGVKYFQDYGKGIFKIINKLLKNSKEVFNYSAGAALFDLHKPWKLISKTPEPIITPRQQYEKTGYVNNVVFPTGAVLDNNKKHVLVYSGGADTVVTVKKIALKDIFKSLERV